MVRLIRLVGIATGSVVIAYLAVSLLVGVFLGESRQTNPAVAVVVVILGGFVFADIMRRGRRSM